MTTKRYRMSLPGVPTYAGSSNYYDYATLAEAIKRARCAAREGYHVVLRDLRTGLIRALANENVGHLSVFADARVSRAP